MVGGQELVGSGKLSGSISGNSIAFQTEGNQLLDHILWMGEINNDTIVGRYRVVPSVAGMQGGLPPQDGRFSVSKQ